VTQGWTDLGNPPFWIARRSVRSLARTLWIAKEQAGWESVKFRSPSDVGQRRDASSSGF
jgi:hypothetical protein